jgi:hypothetical protein
MVFNVEDTTVLRNATTVYSETESANIIHSYVDGSACVITFDKEASIFLNGIVAYDAGGVNYTIDKFDADWNIDIPVSNRAFSFALVKGFEPLSKIITNEEKENVVDLVGARNSSSDAPLNYMGRFARDISKQATLRRVNFSNTGDNRSDFERVDYRAPHASNTPPEEIDAKRPRWSGDGAWSAYTEPKFEFDTDINGIADFWIEGSNIQAESYHFGRKPTDMINWTLIGEEHYLMIPQSVDLNNVRVFFRSGAEVYADGKKLTFGELTDVLAEKERIILTSGTESYTVTIMQTSEIPTVFISTVSGDMNYIHRTKESREPAKILIVDTDGSVTYNGNIDRMNGRGNLTWIQSQKAYNIRLNHDTSIFGMGSFRHWALIPNMALDRSHLRHLLAYTLADEVGIEFSPKTKPVDMYINNEYVGLYYITERVRVGGLVNIMGLETATREVNGGISLDTFPRGGDFSATTPGVYKYFEIPNDPDDITGGYLLEWQKSERYKPTASGFITNRGQPIVIKSPEFASKAQVEYIREFVQDMEDAVYSPNGYNNKGKHYTNYVDEESFVKMQVLYEFTADPDLGTSYFVYKNSNLISDGKLRAAPPWDFDLAFGQTSPWYTPNPEYFRWADARLENYTPDFIMGALYQHNSFFQQAVRMWHTLFSDPIDKMINPHSSVETQNLQYVEDYAKRIQNSVALNNIRWGITTPHSVAVNQLTNFMTRRAAFLTREWRINIADTDVELIHSSTPTKFELNSSITDLTGHSLIENTDYKISHGIERTIPILNLGVYIEHYTKVTGIGFYTGEVKEIIREFKRGDGIITVPGTSGNGDVDGDGRITINDALEILKYLAKLDSKIEHGNDAWNAALIVSKSSPAIADALEILKYLAKLDSVITSATRGV